MLKKKKMKGINRITGIIHKIMILALYFLIYLKIEYQDSENSGINEFQIYKAFSIF